MAAASRLPPPKQVGELRWSSERPSQDGLGWYASEAWIAQRRGWRVRCSGDLRSRRYTPECGVPNHWRANQRKTRWRTRAWTHWMSCAVSTDSRNHAASPPSGPGSKTPSSTQQWKCRCSLSAEPNRCTKLTAPSRAFSALPGACLRSACSTTRRSPSFVRSWVSERLTQRGSGTGSSHRKLHEYQTRVAVNTHPRLQRLWQCMPNAAMAVGTAMVLEADPLVDARFHPLFAYRLAWASL